jgi:hypothetical protein
VSGDPAPTPATFHALGAVALPVQSFTAQGSAALTPASSDAEYWKAVQETLIHSDWARRYSTRAISVIAMFDPAYESAPWTAESRVRAEVHPLHKHRRRAAAVRTAGASPHKPSTHRSHKS